MAEVERSGDDYQGVDVLVDEIESRLLCLRLFDDHLRVIDPFDGRIFHDLGGALLVELEGREIIKRLANGADDADARFSHKDTP